MAVLADYYRCWEAVEVWTNIWIKDVRMKEPVPAIYSRELILWILIAWVFELPEEFNKDHALFGKNRGRYVPEDRPRRGSPSPVVPQLKRSSKAVDKGIKWIVDGSAVAVDVCESPCPLAIQELS
ncbi:hypothetical protein GQ44DRAFT_776774 [Phaeosphaeriaceae sp. PMI808]|nr:hypothetical protein GQ44DRAFT_776774 [Phaeosphaeriaceae sp. PMI808]